MRIFHPVGSFVRTPGEILILEMGWSKLKRCLEVGTGTMARATNGRATKMNEHDVMSLNFQDVVNVYHDLGGISP